MRRISTLIILLAAAVAAAAPAPAPAQERPMATCFWEGPVSTERPTTRGFDGRNFNFPEESATYWIARFNLPIGTRLRVRGGYPYGRYMSLNSYSDGAPTDTLSDPSIAPDPGSVNPFVPGAPRDSAARAWTVTVVDAAVPSGERAPNTLYAKPATGQPIELAYRVYEPDAGRDLTGDTGLPVAELVRADGSVANSEETCAAINDPNREIPIQTVPAETWRAATSCRPEHPAFDPIRWERFFNLDYATASVPADCTEAGFALRRQQQPELKGGFYSNRDTAYVFAHLFRTYGPVVVVQGTMPSYPQTRDGQPVMGSGQLRFWSLCTGESRVTVRTPDCLADRQVPLDAVRRYTIVVSRAADRPANARPECGVAWLDWGERGDGAGRPDYGLLILRNMLVDANFAEAIQRVPRPGMEAEVMKQYFPRSEYTDRAKFEARGCAAAAQPAPPPAPRLVGVPSSRRCVRGRFVTLRLGTAAGQRLRSARVTVNGRRVRTARRGDRLLAVVALPRRRAGRVTVSAVTADGTRLEEKRRYRSCAKKKKRKRKR